MIVIHGIGQDKRILLEYAGVLGLLQTWQYNFVIIRNLSKKIGCNIRLCIVWNMGHKKIYHTHTDHATKKLNSMNDYRIATNEHMHVVDSPISSF